MYLAVDVANYVLGYYCETTGIGISNLKLQKILYFLQADFLSRSCVLFMDDIEAYDYGPVVYDVNKLYCVYGGTTIPYDLIDKDKRYKTRIRSSDAKMIDELLDALKDYSSTGLLSIIHKQTPWIDAYNNRKNWKYIIRNGKPVEIRVISNEALRNFFKEDGDCRQHKEI